MDFTGSSIEEIFGQEAAEAERDERLQSYFYRSSLYDEVISDAQFKLIVGFKGTGKSALMRMAYLHDERKGRTSLWVTPDDFGGRVYEDAAGGERARLAAQPQMMKAIRIWKQAIVELVLRRVAGEAGIPDVVRQKVREGEMRLTELLGKWRPERRYGDVAVYIDDLDRAWAGRSGDRNAVAGLIYAVRDMTRENRQLRVRLSLRNDVYWDVREADQGLDKIEANVVNVRWTQQDIFVMLVKRIMRWVGKEADEVELTRWTQEELAGELGVLFEPRMVGTQAWRGKEIHRVLLSLVRRRPRDMVKLCTFAAREAQQRKRQRIGGQEIVKIIPDYSMGRVRDLINEFEKVQPLTARLVFGMRPTSREKGKWRYRTDELIGKLKQVVTAIGGQLDPMEAARWLYKIGFLTARRDHEDGYIERKYFDENPYLLTREVGDMGYGWEVHPAYREAVGGARIEAWWPSVDVESWAET